MNERKILSYPEVHYNSGGMEEGRCKGGQNTLFQFLSVCWKLHSITPLPSTTASMPC